jgi:peptidoglycan/LPS O-acetylase OafA/YrhL
MKRIPALDGIRGVAILLVLCGHAVYVGGYAGYGVSLFFVLSGYLITGILLDCRVEIERGATPLRMLGIFYLRRALRIFPAYYLMLAVCLALNLDYFRSLFWWHALYADNFLMWKINGWIGGASHLWSLCVEEQFYLFWPLIVLTAPKRALSMICVATVAMGFVSAVTLASEEWFFSMLPTTAAIYLGMGALIVVLQRSEPKWITALSPFALAGLVLIIALNFDLPTGLGVPFNWTAAIHLLLLSSFLGWVVHRASVPSLIGRIAEFAPLRYLGTISYGVYLYHFPLLMWVDSRWPHQPVVRATLVIGLSLLVAVASYYLFETPIRDIGRRFSYRQSPVTPSAGFSSSVPRSRL